MRLMSAACSECGGAVRWKTIAQEFEKEGMKVRLAGLKAWVCEKCGEVYFQPGGAAKVSRAVNSLFALALAARQHKGRLTARLP